MFSVDLLHGAPSRRLLMDRHVKIKPRDEMKLRKRKRDGWIGSSEEAREQIASSHCGSTLLAREIDGRFSQRHLIQF